MSDDLARDDQAAPQARLRRRGGGRRGARRPRRGGRRRRRRRPPRPRGRGRAGRHPPVRLHPPGYAGWRWSVTVARASRQKTVTVDEIVLIPGDEAIVAPAWVPYRERIQPGDLSPGDLLPVEDDDPRLVPTYSFGDDPLVDRRQGPDAAGRRGPRPRPGPHPLAGGPRPRRAALVRRRRRPRRAAGPGRRPTPARPAASWSGSPARCRRCSASAPTATPTTTAGWSRFDHGCGAHSEVRLAKKHEPQPLPEHVFDTVAHRRDRDLLTLGLTWVRPRGPAPGPSAGAGSTPARTGRGRSRPGRSTATTGGRRPRAGRRTGAGRGTRAATARADLDGADAVDVERLDVGDDVGAVADLVLHRLLVAELHACTLAHDHVGETSRSHNPASALPCCRS